MINKKNVITTDCLIDTLNLKNALEASIKIVNHSFYNSAINDKFIFFLILSHGIEM